MGWRVKSLDRKTIEWHRRVQRAGIRQQQREAGRREHRAALAKRLLTRSSRPPSQRRHTVVLRMPLIINAERDDRRASLLNLVSSMMTGLTRESSIKLDFSQVQRVYPGGMLVLLAFLERMLVLFPGRIRASCRPGSMPAQLLHHFGYGTRLGVSKVRNTPRHPNVVNWRHETGCEAEGAKVQKQVEHFQSVAGGAMPEGLYDVLIEAMTNTRHHAYDGLDLPEDFRRWWMFSSCSAPEPGKVGHLYIAAYDMGAGIPQRMRGKLIGVAEHVRAGFNSLMANFGHKDFTDQDCQLLGVAVDENRSSTGLNFRGKGLPEMKEFAAKTSGGRMTIISGHGLYRYHSGSGRAARCDPPVAGTLILWSLPLNLPEATS